MFTEVEGKSGEGSAKESMEKKAIDTFVLLE